MSKHDKNWEDTALFPATNKAAEAYDRAHPNEPRKLPGTLGFWEAIFLRPTPISELDLRP